MAQTRQLLDPLQFLAVALVASPRQLIEIVEAYRAPEPLTRNAARAALLRPGHLMLYENLHLFLARRFLIDPVNPQLHNLVLRSISSAIVGYVRIPIETMDFLCHLYRVVFWRTGAMAVLPAMSPPTLSPSWYVNLQAEERHLIRASMGWAEETQELFFLHFCALLTVEQIGCALDSQGPGDLDTIIDDLEQCWNNVL